MSEPTPARKSLFAGLRSSFLTGLIVVLPVGLTIYLVWAVIGWIDAWILPLIPGPWQPEVLVKRFFGPDAQVPVRGVGVIVFLVVTVIVGWIAKGLIGRSIIRSAERVVDRMPVVRSIYNGLKQIAETVFSSTGSSFTVSCLVEFPCKGTWSVGLISGRTKGEIGRKVPADDIITVFIPTTPNPTNGFLIFMPSRDVIVLDMSVEDAAKVIISGGLVFPPGSEDIEPNLPGLFPPTVKPGD